MNVKPQPYRNRTQTARSSSTSSTPRRTSSRTLSIADPHYQLSRPSSSSGHQRHSERAPSTKVLPSPSHSLVDSPSHPSPVPLISAEGDPALYRMAEPVSPTPTPRTGSRRNIRVARPRGLQSRSTAPVEAEAVEEGRGTGVSEGEVDAEQELFGLLGVISPPLSSVEPVINRGGRANVGQGENGRKGVLAISKADIEASASASASGSGGVGVGVGSTKKAVGKGRRNEPVKPEGARSGAQTRSRTAAPDSNPHTDSDTPFLDADTPLSSSRSSTSKPKQGKPRNASKPLSGISAQLASHPTPSSALPTISNHHGLTPSTSTTSTTGSAFDTSSMSRSLPSEAAFGPSRAREFGGGAASLVQVKGSGRGRKKKGVGVDSEDESKVWDAPSDPGPPVLQDMTWQQRLGSYPNVKPDFDLTSRPSSNSTSTSSTSTSSKPKKSRPMPTPSPLNPSTSASHIPSPNPARPSHSRRSSADTLPLPSHSRHLSFPLQPSRDRQSKATQAAQQPPPSAYPLSTFDTLPPFNPAMNVHRAPQTPAKGGLAKKYAVMELPLLTGSFPRLNGIGGGAGAEGGGKAAGLAPVSSGTASGPMSVGSLGSGGNYAGASFHNSPHGRALPKPDMEDF